MKVSVLATPANLLHGALEGAAAIVIDALRMTSVAATAMEHGCVALLACAEVEEAKEAAAASGALAAGAILARLERMGAPLERDDMALAVCMLYEAARRDLPAALADTKHFRRLRSLGLEADLRYCLTEDTLESVPEKRADGWFA